jgi:two-component system CheB/CheR fusion protein
VLQVGTVPEFIERLRQEPTEIDALLQDMLIGVTNFFRDPQAFSALEKEVIARLFDGKGPDDTVRVWVPGCSTGEEAYSNRHPAARAHVQGERGATAADLRQRHRRGGAACRPYRPVSRGDRQGQSRRSGLSAISCARMAPTHRLGPARDLPFLGAQSAARRAVLQARPDLLPQPADLPHAGAAERLIPLFHYALNESGYCSSAARRT